MAIIKQINNNKAQSWTKIRGNEVFIDCWWECELWWTSWKSPRIFLKELNIEMLYDRAIQVLGVYPKDSDYTTEVFICTSVFIAAPFTVAKK